jgi:hypothetical protein
VREYGSYVFVFPLFGFIPHSSVIFEHNVKMFARAWASLTRK